MENVKKNYKRVLMLILIEVIFLVGLYIIFTYFDDTLGNVGEDGFALALFGGFLIIGALIIYGMIYIFVLLTILAFVFASIARFTYNGDGNKVGSYRGFMITTYVFLILIALGMFLCCGVMAGAIGYVITITFAVILIINMISTFSANIIDTPMNNMYYGSNMYYGNDVNYNNQIYNNQTYSNQTYSNQTYSNQNYNNSNFDNK